METLSQQIKIRAQELGFDACGFCKATNVETRDERDLKLWLEKGYNAGMDYLSRNTDKRCDPTLLVDGAKSIISLALNYYPSKKQSLSAPQFAYYAYGKDYHEILKHKQQQLIDYIQQLVPSISGRMFCDTAPILERYWAAKAGLGFIGKNSLLIIPNMGSYFFLGELIIDQELEYDKPLTISCGSCTNCLDLCPTQSFEEAYVLDSEKCISYQTIENKKDLHPFVTSKMTNYVYGCDICQHVCPWNRFAKPHCTPELDPSSEFLNLSALSLSQLSIDQYRSIFKGSAVKRAKYTGLMRNMHAYIRNKRF